MRMPIKNRRAVILTLFVVLLPAMLILLGFSVDMAYMQLTQTELRAATDNAARAAAEDFARNENKAAARAVGRQIAQRFEVAGRPLRLKNSDFEFGRATQRDSGAYDFDPSGFPPNAVRVNSARNASSRDGAVPLFFGRLIGRSEFQPTQRSTAAFLNVDICLVLDRSTSMKKPATSNQSGMSIYDRRFCSRPWNDSRWAALERAVQDFINELNRNSVVEKVGIVTYGSDINQILPGLCGREPEATLDLALTDNLSSVMREVRRRSRSIWNGNTLIESGMNIGIRELTSLSNGREFAEKVMIVLTDGQPTGGDAVAAAVRAKADGIRVYTVTFGVHANQAHMRAVASAGDGRHIHAANSQQLRDVFRDLAAEATVLVE